MSLTLVAMLVGLTQSTSAPVDQFQMPTANNTFTRPSIVGRSFYPRANINMRSPLSGSVLVAQAIRAGRVRVPVSPFGVQSFHVTTCSPAPCLTPNVQASEGGAPVNETPIAVDPMRPGHMLTGGNDYNCPSIQGFYATNNTGSTWNHTCMRTLSGTGGDGDPAVGYDTNGNAYIAGIDSPGATSVIAIEKSSNNGMTWSAPSDAVNGIAPYTFVDKEWLQIDTTLTSPRRDTLYISTTEFDPSSNSIMAVAHSTNGGASFTNVEVDAAVYPVVDQFTDLAIGSDGTVYLSWMRCSATGPTGDCGGTPSSIMFSKSSDGGNTWSVPVKIATANLAPDSCGAFYGCLPNTSERVSNVPAIDVDRSGRRFDGRLYVSYYNWTGNRLQVMIARSKDGGATWGKKPVDASAPNDQFFPWLTTNATGIVGITWLDRRLDSNNINYDSFATTSVDGATSFAPSTSMSSVSSNPFNDGFGSGFMGDYTGNIWSRNTLFASWTDTRSGIAQDETGGFRVK